MCKITAYFAFLLKVEIVLGLRPQLPGTPNAWLADHSEVNIYIIQPLTRNKSSTQRRMPLQKYLGKMPYLDRSCGTTM